jgi:hydroxypyruvate isomerase
MPQVKLSVPDWCFVRKHTDIERYYQNLADVGYRAVEMVPPANRVIARKAGLEIINISAPGMEQGLNDPDNHTALIPQICEVIDDAAKWDIASVIIFSGNSEGLDKKTGQRAVSRGVEQLLPYAEAAGVTLLFEMLCQQDHPDYEADCSSYGFELVKRFESPHLRVLYDIYHMLQMSEDIQTDLLDNASLIGHIHVAEPPNRTCPLTNSPVKWQQLLRETYTAGYQGYIGMEFLPGSQPNDAILNAQRLFSLHVD